MPSSNPWNMVETTENQICFPYYNLLKAYLLSVALLVIPSIVLTSFLGMGFYSTLFTFPILVLSTIFIVTFTKKCNNKLVLVENPASRMLLADEVEEKVLKAVVETVAESDAAQGADDHIGILQEFEVESLDLPAPSDSESNSESIDWMSITPGKNYMERSPEEIPGDESDSEDDEEGLIEIAIPSGEEPKVNLQTSSNLPTFLPESIFKEQDLVEILSEMNEVIEEENLIEIDISMGSIKCPRFEIEA